MNTLSLQKFSDIKWFATIKKTTDRSSIDEIAIKNALADIQNKTKTPTSAARKYGLKRTTLISRLKKAQSSELHVSPIFSSKYTTHQIFSKDEERELVDYFKKCSAQTYGFSFSMARSFSFQYAKKNKVKVPRSWTIKKEAGIDWVRGFLRRNPDISLRKPENISLARIRGFNQEAVPEFFDNLRRLYDKNSYKPQNIYNLDETGITTVLAPPKVVTMKKKIN